MKNIMNTLILTFVLSFSFNAIANFFDQPEASHYFGDETGYHYNNRSIAQPIYDDAYRNGDYDNGYYYSNDYYDDGIDVGIGGGVGFGGGGIGIGFGF